MIDREGKIYKKKKKTPLHGRSLARKAATQRELSKWFIKRRAALFKTVLDDRRSVTGGAKGRIRGKNRKYALLRRQHVVKLRKRG